MPWMIILTFFALGVIAGCMSGKKDVRKRTV